MVPIKNRIICLIITLNSIGIIINYFLLYGKSSSSYEYSNRENTLKYIVIISYFLSMYFTFTLIFTFNVDHFPQNQAIQQNQVNQTNHKNHQFHQNQGNNAHLNGSGSNGTINCGEGGKDCGPLLLVIVVFLVFILIVIILVKIYQAMGRTNTAYCSLISLSVVYMTISILCFGLIHFLNFYIIGGISSFLFIFHVLIIVIPNCRNRQKNNDLENTEIKDPILMTENGTNNILVSDKSVTTPIYNQEDNSKVNDIEKPIESINAIDVCEKNNEKYDQCFDEKNELLNNQNDQVSQTPISRVSDLSNAPLPNDIELPTEEEIYKNYSNL